MHDISHLYLALLLPRKDPHGSGGKRGQLYHGHATSQGCNRRDNASHERKLLATTLPQFHLAPCVWQRHGNALVQGHFGISMGRSASLGNGRIFIDRVRTNGFTNQAVSHSLSGQRVFTNRSTSSPARRINISSSSEPFSGCISWSIDMPNSDKSGKHDESMEGEGGGELCPVKPHKPYW